MVALQVCFAYTGLEPGSANRLDSTSTTTGIV